VPGEEIRSVSNAWREIHRRTVRLTNGDAREVIAAASQCLTFLVIVSMVFNTPVAPVYFRRGVPDPSASWIHRAWIGEHGGRDAIADLQVCGLRSAVVLIASVVPTAGTSPYCGCGLGQTDATHPPTTCTH